MYIVDFITKRIHKRVYFFDFDINKDSISEVKILVFIYKLKTISISQINSDWT